MSTRLSRMVALVILDGKTLTWKGTTSLCLVRTSAHCNISLQHGVAGVRVVIIDTVFSTVVLLGLAHESHFASRGVPRSGYPGTRIHGNSRFRKGPISLVRYEVDDVSKCRIRTLGDTALPNCWIVLTEKDEVRRLRNR
jgi:hypothetical protein